jgi:HK97 family phage major capsid protein
LAGIVLVSRESIEDAAGAGTAWPQSETARVIQDAFSHDLDAGLINGDGQPPNPTGVLGVADAVTADALVPAAAAALAAIGEAGGQASHLALSPTAYATEAARTGNDGHPIWPGRLTDIFGLRLVPVPGLTLPLVYDAHRVRLLASRDLAVDYSTHYAPAFRTDSVALRISGRFNVAIPTPGKAIRQLTVAIETVAPAKSAPAKTAPGKTSR